MNSSCFNALPIAISLLVVLAPSFVTTHWATAQTTVLQSDAVQSEVAADLADQFLTPPKNAYPETWFHLIGGNVNREALTTDLEAVAKARISGIQLFHGRGRVWPGIEPSAVKVLMLH
jgi:hypothetical protein